MCDKIKFIVFFTLIFFYNNLNSAILINNSNFNLMLGIYRHSECKLSSLLHVNGKLNLIWPSINNDNFSNRYCILRPKGSTILEYCDNDTLNDAWSQFHCLHILILSEENMQELEKNQNDKCLIENLTNNTTLTIILNGYVNKLKDLETKFIIFNPEHIAIQKKIEETIAIKNIPLPLKELITQYCDELPPNYNFPVTYSQVYKLILYYKVISKSQCCEIL